LVTALRDVVVGYQHEGAIEERFAAIDQVLQGRSEALLRDCDVHLTYAGNNFAPFLWQFYKSHRAAIFRLLRLLPLRSASSDTRLEAAIRFLLDHSRSTGQWLPVVRRVRVAPRQYTEEPLLELSWIPVGWWRLVTDLPSRNVAPTRINRRHFETCVVSHMLTALANGDLYIVGADRFGDPFPKLCSWDDYRARIGDYGTQLGLPVSADAFVAALQQWLTTLAETTDQAFPANTQVKIVKGRPVLRRLRRQPDPPGLNDLKRALAEHQQARSILDALAYTEHWLHWTNHFGPLSGFESKLEDPIEAYLTAVFCYGCAIGPSATAAALGTLDRRQISRIDQYHISEQQLDAAIQCFITAYQRCSLPQAWGSLRHASIDGTKWELYEQNLLSEQHIRYGGYGAIGLYLLSSTYIALMVNLIACSAWEGHYLLDVLEQNQSSIQPSIIHSDTQGQNEAIFGLAFLRGIELMPRIRNWQDLILYRPSPSTTYTHIDAIFSDKAIDWELIRTHVPDLLRIALSIKEGRILPSTILRTISAGSSSLARANRELGRVRRTGLLLRIMAEAELRAIIQRETNKSEQFNRFVKWLAFGSAGVIRENDRAAQQKALKYNLLLANAMIFYNTVTLSKDLRSLITHGYYVDPVCVAALSPYATKDLERFGKYTLNLAQVPDPVDYHTPVVSQVSLEDPDRPGKQTSSEQREGAV
jgi:TnpA family transposase